MVSDDIRRHPYENALVFLKDGHRAARAGWNGKAMWLVLAHGGTFKDAFGRVQGELEPFIVMKTADNKFVVALLANRRAGARLGDGRMSIDKLLHALVGALIIALLWPLSLWLAAGLCVGAALGKELYDHRHRDRHTPDHKDALATIAGGVVAFVWLFVVLPVIFWAQS